MPETLGDRVEEALERAEMSVKELENALEEEGVVGGSYANLHRLKSDKFDRPSANLLYGIARATGADLTWLVSGDEPPTPESEAERLATEGADLRDDVLDQIRGGLGPGADALIPEPTPAYTVTEGEPPPERPPSGGGIRRAFAMHLWKRLIGTRRGQEAFLDRSLGGRIGSALSGPLDAFDVEPADLPSDSLADYLQAMTAALRALCPEPPEPSPSIRDQEDEE